MIILFLLSVAMWKIEVIDSGDRNIIVLQSYKFFGDPQKYFILFFNTIRLTIKLRHPALSVQIDFRHLDNRWREKKHSRSLRECLQFFQICLTKLEDYILSNSVFSHSKRWSSQPLSVSICVFLNDTGLDVVERHSLKSYS